jgi:hypothetical protein
VERSDLDDDTDDKFPLLARLLSPNYKQRNSILKNSNNRALDDNLISSYESKAPGSYGKRAELLGCRAQNPY